MNRIPSPTPVNVPAQLAAYYPDLYVREITIRPAPGRPWPCTLSWTNYNHDTDTLQPGGALNRVQIADVQAKAQTAPLIGVALLAMTAATEAAIYEDAKQRTVNAARMAASIAHAQLDAVTALPDDDASKAAKLADATAAATAADAALAVAQIELATVQATTGGPAAVALLAALATELGADARAALKAMF